MHKKKLHTFFLRAPPLVSSFFLLLLLWTSLSLFLSLSLSRISYSFAYNPICQSSGLYQHRSIRCRFQFSIFNRVFTFFFWSGFIWESWIRSLFQIINSLNWRVFHAIGFSEIVLLLLTWVLIFFIIFSIVIELQLIDFWPKETRVYRWL